MQLAQSSLSSVTRLEGCACLFTSCNRDCLVEASPHPFCNQNCKLPRSWVLQTPAVACVGLNKQGGSPISLLVVFLCVCVHPPLSFASPSKGAAAAVFLGCYGAGAVLLHGGGEPYVWIPCASRSLALCRLPAVVIKMCGGEDTLVDCALNCCLWPCMRCSKGLEHAVAKSGCSFQARGGNLPHIVPALSPAMHNTHWDWGLGP